MDTDMARIARGEGSETAPHIVNDAALGNVTVAEREPSWARRRMLLVTHFRAAWERKEILWLKTAAECRPNYRHQRPLCPNRYCDGEAVDDQSEDEAEDPTPEDV